jgi:solute carrier family 25 (mitochondrial aspartate/glutamate transporter), member 12/13
MVKTRLQNQSALGPGGLRYTGPIDCFRKIVAQEGWAGLYRGLKPNLIGVTPEKAIKLTLNDVFREHFTQSNGDGQIRLWQEMAAGAGAGFFQVAATNPMEIVKLRMQLQGESGGVKMR